MQRNDHLATLKQLGFPEDVASNALLVTGGMSLDAALDYLQTYCMVQTDLPPKKQEEEIDLPEDPQSLEDYGYHYDEEGMLRQLENGEKFLFINQKHYEKMGEMIVKDIQERLVKEHGMEEYIIPIEPIPDGYPTSSFFLSKGALENDVLLILVHGSGNVRAGQWARKPCFNDGLEIGSVLPYVARAHELGMGVCVMNPNLNSQMVKGRLIDVKGSESPEHHLIYVWDRFLNQCAAKHIFIVAHSYGGIATINLIENKERELFPRLRALALTDSMHFFKHRGLSRDALNWLSTECVDWVTSKDPLDTPVDNGAECYCCSAGTLLHEHTSGLAKDSIFKFFLSKQETYEKANTDQ